MAPETEEVDVDEGSAEGAETPELSDRNVSRSIVDFLRAREVHLTQSGAGFVAARGSLSIVNGGCGPVLANGGVSIRNGGCGPMIANGDVSIENGGTQGILAAGGATIGPKALVGFVVSPNVTVADGGRVLFGPRQALAFGAAAGTALALLSRIGRRR
jgi:hypothetical protein